MKVLTIKQPYASLIANGIKKYEFRTWKTKYRGEVLIHAGKGVDKVAMEKFSNYSLEYPVGCIIAKVTISACIEVNDDFRDFLKQENPLVYSHVVNDKDWKGYAFKIENVEKLEPKYMNGKLGLWNYEEKE